MAKSWHYPRWRRMALQVMLCVTLLIVTGAAYYVGRQRTTALDIQLQEKPIPVSSVLVRAPKGWEAQRNDSLLKLGDPVKTLVYFEGKPKPEPYSRRVITVTTSRKTPGKSPAAVLEEDLRIRANESFDFLGQKGVLAEVREPVGPTMPRPGLYTCTVLPNGVAVIVVYEAYPEVSPSGRDHLRQFVDGLSVAVDINVPASGKSEKSPATR